MGWVPMILSQNQLVQLMALCQKATLHCLSKHWPKSLSIYGTTRPLGYSKQKLEIVDHWSSRMTTTQPCPNHRKFGWPMGPWPLTYWSRNDAQHIVPIWFVFVQHMNIIQEINNEPHSGHHMWNRQTDGVEPIYHSQLHSMGAIMMIVELKYCLSFRLWR